MGKISVSLRWTNQPSVGELWIMFSLNRQLKNGS